MIQNFQFRKFRFVYSNHFLSANCSILFPYLAIPAQIFYTGIHQHVTVRALRKQWHRRPSDPLRDYLKHNFIKEENILSINPMMFLQFKNSWQTFTRNHPKFPAFCNAVSKRALKEGSIMAITVTTPDGEKIETNLRIKAEDLELLKELTN